MIVDIARSVVLPPRCVGKEQLGLSERSANKRIVTAAHNSLKAPEDTAAFKAWLAQISQSVAEAAKEGGFLGFGGVQVSEAEKATLAEISTALA